MSGCRCGRRLVHYSAALPVCTYCKAVSEYCTCRPLHETGSWVRVRVGYFTDCADLVMLAHDGGTGYYVVSIPALAMQTDPEMAVLHAYDKLEAALGVEL